MIATIKEKRPARINGTSNRADARETTAYCPRCKAFQTVWFNGETLMPTRKFTQQEGKIYHDCGSGQPCRLYYGL